MRTATTLFILVASQLLYAQSNQTTPPKIASHGGGEYKMPPNNCMTDSVHQALMKNINQQIERLQQKQMNPPRKTPSIVPQQVAFNWPLQPVPAYTDPGYYGVSNFVDQDPTSALLDYSCGQRTYDGHTGTDIFLWPFPWTMMANSSIKVVAAAAGTIVYLTDGNNDQSCQHIPCANYNANLVAVQHTDGSVSLYYHLKTNSVTTKVVGDLVAQGEYLGLVGSSGCSSAPHLHFEVHSAYPVTAANLVDPFYPPTGMACNIYNTNNSSWWSSQIPNRNPNILKIMTNSAAPNSVASCSSNQTVINDEAMNASDAFRGGDLAYFSVYLSDEKLNQPKQFTIYYPNNTIYTAGQYTANPNSPDYYSASYWYWAYFLPNGGPYGTYRFEISHSGVTQSHNFTVNAPLPIELLNFTGKKTSSGVLLAWETRSEKDNDYFSVEYSPDAKSYKEIGKVKAAGTSNISQNYSFLHSTALNPSNYYRLKQVDFDGNFSYSNILEVSSSDKDIAMKIYPNPTHNSITIENIDPQYPIFIVDYLGRIVKKEIIQETQTTIDINNLVSGVYILYHKDKMGRLFKL